MSLAMEPLNLVAMELGSLPGNNESGNGTNNESGNETTKSGNGNPELV